MVSPVIGSGKCKCCCAVQITHSNNVIYVPHCVRKPTQGVFHDKVSSTGATGREASISQHYVVRSQPPQKKRGQLIWQSSEYRHEL